jgi:glucose-6-phosphate dehydrogenase assembly protein OpcA
MKNDFDPAAIERRLLELQRELSPQKTRSNLFNLLIVSPPQREAYIESVLAHLLGKRSARLLRISDSEAEESSTTVRARCLPDKEEFGVCFQEIIITNGKDNAGKAPGSWTPLLIRDIPVFGLWLSSFDNDGGLLDTVREQADKIIIDSSIEVKGGRPLSETAAFIRSYFLEYGVLIADIAWKHLAGVREVCAGIFEEPRLQDRLFSIRTLSLGGFREPELSFLRAWFAARLGWRREDGGFTDRDGTRIEVHTAASEGRSLVFTFSDKEKLSLRFSENGYVDMVLPDSTETRSVFTETGDAEIVLEEVDSIYDDGVYMETIKTIAPGDADRN